MTLLFYVWAIGTMNSSSFGYSIMFHKENWSIKVVITFVTLLVSCVIPASLLIAAEGIDKRPSLLIVGTAHFNNPGRDIINEELEDITSPMRQRELMAFLAALEKYDPTHVAVEFAANSQDQIDEAYNAYLNGDFELAKREQHQLGYRLGKQLGLNRIYGVDWNENPPGDPEAYDFITFANDNGMQEVIDKISDPDDPDRPDVSDMSGQTISEWLVRINSPDILQKMHQVYFDIAGIHASGEHPGADWVGSWYGRNLKILNNILDIAEGDESRIVVFYGLGHAYLLNQFARESGYFDVVTLDSIIE